MNNLRRRRAQLIILGSSVPVPAAPTLTSPANAAVLTDTTPDLAWDAVANAATYDVEVRETLTGTPTATGLLTNAYTVSPALDPAIDYSWRVRGVNSAGVAGEWSSTRTFTFSYATIEAAIAAPLWMHLRETSGTAVDNSGTVGDPADGTWTAGVGTPGAVGQTGRLGANEAYLFGGTDSYITIAAQTALNNLTKYTYGLLLNPTTPGESNLGQLIATRNGAGKMLRIHNASFAVHAFHTSNATTATTTTTNNFLVAGEWQWIFATFDNDGDRKIHLYRYDFDTDTLVEASYAQHDAMTGTIAFPSVDIMIGARDAGQLAYNGSMDEVFIENTVLSVAYMTAIGKKT